MLFTEVALKNERLWLTSSDDATAWFYSWRKIEEILQECGERGSRRACTTF